MAERGIKQGIKDGVLTYLFQDNYIRVPLTDIYAAVCEDKYLIIYAENREPFVYGLSAVLLKKAIPDLVTIRQGTCIRKDCLKGIKVNPAGRHEVVLRIPEGDIVPTLNLVVPRLTLPLVRRVLKSLIRG